MAGQEHWDDRYETIGAQSVSWFQDRPAMSLDLLAALDVGPATSVIDIGGGASNLVDHLLAGGHTDLAVLDLSTVALEVAHERVGDDAEVTWLVEDLLEWVPERRWDAWRDRAVLHFLLADEDRRRYVEVLRRTVAPGGAVVIGTFAENGPTECSALPGPPALTPGPTRPARAERRDRRTPRDPPHPERCRTAVQLARGAPARKGGLMTEQHHPSMGLVLDSAGSGRAHAVLGASARLHQRQVSSAPTSPSSPNGRPGPKLLLQHVTEPKAGRTGCTSTSRCRHRAEATRLVALGASESKTRR